MSYGTAAGWPSPAIPILLAGQTGNNMDPITPEIASWISSVLCLGGLFGCFVFGFLCHRFGCRITGYLASVPFIVNNVFKLPIIMKLLKVLFAGCLVTNSYG